MKKQIFKSIFLLTVFFAAPGFVRAAELYVSQNGTKTSGVSVEGDWSAENCYGNLQAAIGQMSANDVIVLDDGTYTGINNTSINGINNKPPSGTGGLFTTIKARNIGQSILDGESVRNLINIGSRDYIHLNGIVFKNGTYPGSLVTFQGYFRDAEDLPSNIEAHHIKVTNCGFSETADVTSITNRTNMLNFLGIDYGLIENCWVWGNIGRYALYLLENHHAVVRRNVIRIDRATEEDGNAGNLAAIRIYDTTDSVLQNNILIDTDQTGQYGELDIMTGMPKFLFSDTPWNPANIKFVGNMGINNTEASVAYMGNDFQAGSTWTDNVFLGFRGGVRQDSVDYIDINKNTFGNIVDTTAANDRVYSVRLATATTVRNSLLFGFTAGSALDMVRGVSSNYWSLYNNQNNYSQGATVGTNDITATNPLTAAILYPPRIEAESYLKGAGEGGSDIGGEVLYKIGTDGTFYGETGYNTVTAQPLWPWPNENITKQHMSSYNLHGIDGTRGFAGGVSMDGSSQTLTRYIWEYLGNEIPCDIYETCSGDVITPSAPTSLSVM